MNTKKIWTPEAYTAMFQLLPTIKVNNKIVGRYTKEWQYKPSHMSVKEFEEVCQIMLDQLVSAGFFPHKAPKGYKAVLQQLAHATYPSNDPRFSKIRARLRWTAYREGFMDMCDIVDIEREAKERRINPRRKNHKNDQR